ncbi:MAG: trypsin-like serine protease [Saprospiraceae bacterium]|nr:trypsin-like serine protease [Saprospiraceae bacterium]
MPDNIADILDLYKQVLIQIATPQNTGTGFFLKRHDIIVTNEHVVRGNRKVVITGTDMQKQLADVLYIDATFDLAFLSPPSADMPQVSLLKGPLREGDQIIAIGHPFGLKFSATNGIISNTSHEMNDLTYVQHDAALNPGNSGGPLVTMNGEVAGINTFIIRQGNNIGFSLPSDQVLASIQMFKDAGSVASTRCHACRNLVTAESAQGDYCGHCGTKVQLPDEVEIYEPLGVSKTVEDILVALGYNIDLSRVGPNQWQIEKGSAAIQVSYHMNSGLIIGDAYLAKLPKEHIDKIYSFMLQENYNLEALSFSVKGNDIILSLIIYDRYLSLETGKRMLEYLFEKADAYDNILVDQYGARWKKVKN